MAKVEINEVVENTAIVATGVFVRVTYRALQRRRVKLKF